MLGRAHWHASYFRKHTEYFRLESVVLWSESKGWEVRTGSFPGKVWRIIQESLHPLQNPLTSYYAWNSDKKPSLLLHAGVGKPVGTLQRGWLPQLLLSVFAGKTRLWGRDAWESFVGMKRKCKLSAPYGDQQWQIFGAVTLCENKKEENWEVGRLLPSLATCTLWDD